MDGQRFDAIARRLTERVTRRRTLAVALGMAATATVGADGALARTTCRPIGAGCLRNSQCCGGRCETRRSAPRSQRHRCVCADGLHACTPGGCVDLDSNSEHCGSCGAACADGGACVEGVCESTSVSACVGGGDIGATCASPTDCCSLSCAAGVCVPPSVDCSTYNGANVLGGDTVACYVLIGDTLGSVVVTSEVPCGGSVPAELTDDANVSCSSHDDCQSIVTGAGLANVRGVCLGLLVICPSGDKCFPAPITGGGCGFIQTSDATCTN